MTNQFISNSDNDVFNYHNIWMWIAIIELVLILYLLLFQKKPESTRAKFKREAKGEVIDFENIINSSFHVKPLYDELKVKCHPDRFIKDSEKNQVAIELSQEISKNKTNYKKLIELKELAKQKLNINF
ncbi:MAG: hypothetical protein JXB49_08790 [Bacteroidales bacterium]|nr:hypothetical protein [Bacteroidales bacterium]